ncbi:sulfite exporter TauE/SafE family protein [Salinimonas lutimaris]|uniref:sulfite exporter TauE/SafE family protein n=1 Tax=Salinimonas lutimaris TaxID=914153 RepID=UPI001E2BACB4|nr:sulfite exporter TauE/SafE family protein [Salinimonas lutimaris]
MSVSELLTAGGTIAPLSALLLIVLSGLTALMTATLGAGGGVLLLAVMASVLPVSALIPVHGLVQLGANANRAALTFSHLDRPMFSYFSLGAVAGAVLASFLVIQLPLDIIQCTVAVFILIMVWGPKPKARRTLPPGYILAGFFTTVLTMFVGATGPLVAAFAQRHRYDKLQLTATFASCMTFQHALKALVFSLVGFAFWQWLPLVLSMIVTGAAGTWIGLRLLRQLSSAWFIRAFKIVVTLLALRLLWQAMAAHSL